MTNKLSFQIEKKGFPINIGEVEFFFGTTPEELTRFLILKLNLRNRLRILSNNLNRLRILNNQKKKTQLRLLL